jgi:hypothetical protein
VSLTASSTFVLRVPVEGVAPGRSYLYATLGSPWESVVEALARASPLSEQPATPTSPVQTVVTAPVNTPVGCRLSCGLGLAPVRLCVPVCVCMCMCLCLLKQQVPVGWE